MAGRQHRRRRAPGGQARGRLAHEPAHDGGRRGPFLDAKYGAYRRSWEQDKALPADDAWSARFDDLARDRFVLGDPVRVREEIARYRERLGITT